MNPNHFLPNRFRRAAAVVLTALALIILIFPAAAQDENPEYRLNVKRNFGFSSGNQIKGSFTHSIVGDIENIQSVTYLIDGKEMAVISEAPFQITYQTEDYAVGWHDLSARITTTDGRTVETPVRQFQFVTAEEEFGAVRNIIFPLLGGIALVTLIGVAIQSLLMRDKFSMMAPGTPRNYGFRGGTICKHCQRPFSIHLWAFNFGLWRFDRCDFCGKWSFVTRVPLEILRAAELAEKTAADSERPQIANDPAEELKKKLDDSRYTDLR